MFMAIGVTPTQIDQMLTLLMAALILIVPTAARVIEAKLQNILDDLSELRRGQREAKLEVRQTRALIAARSRQHRAGDVTSVTPSEEENIQ